MIGVFDSGVGGLSVLAEIRAVMPDADLLYVADQGRAPYGTRALDEVAAISLDVTTWLLDQGAETIVVACNTASAAALDRLRSEFPTVPIVGMEPAVKPAASMTRSGTIAVFATAATFQGRLFESLLNTHAVGLEVIRLACPEWVTLVEQGQNDGPIAESAVAGPVGEAMAAGADVFALGCTHFSFLAPSIGRAAGATVSLIDPAPAVAAQVSRVATHPGVDGSTVVATSGDPFALEALLTHLGVINVERPLLRFPL